jgi:hypothetical protein
VIVGVMPDTMPEKSNPWSSMRVPIDPGAKTIFWAEAAPSSSTADPLINADPLPLTLPSTVTLPPLAHNVPVLTTSLRMKSPPVPVASRIPELTTALALVSITSGCFRWRRWCLR